MQLSQIYSKPLKSLSLAELEAIIEPAIEARESLIAFTKYTKADYAPARHHELVASHLEAVERGDINRLMVFMPPRHGKSELVSRRFPAWYLGRNPTNQIISASYNSDLAAEFGRDVRNLIASPEVYRVFDGMTLRPDSQAADRWNTNRGGSYIAAGVGSGITGRGAHLAVIDDPFKDRKEADSQTVRDNVHNWYKSTLYTRLMPGGRIVLTVTRWHEDDLAGRLLNDRQAEDWVIVNLPALAEERDMLERNPGDPLWPEWYPLSTLERIRQTIGSYEWFALYQQRPTSDKGNIFKKEWWQYYRDIPKFEKVIQSWDTAYSDKAESDFSVCLTWGQVKGNVYLIDRWKKQVDFPDLKRAAIALAMRHKPSLILVEAKASGKSLYQELRRDSTYPVAEVKVDRDKVSRAHAITPMIEGGRVFLPEWASWTDEYVTELAAFPKSAHDDEVDATTQALNYLRSGLRETLDIYQKVLIPSNGGMSAGWLGA